MWKNQILPSVFHLSNWMDSGTIYWDEDDREKQVPKLDLYFRNAVTEMHESMQMVFKATGKNKITILCVFCFYSSQQFINTLRAEVKSYWFIFFKLSTEPSNLSRRIAFSI